MSPLVRALLGAAIAVSILAALGYGLTRDPRVLPAVKVGEPAPEFELTSLDGRRISSADFRGKPTLINFWASWCTECKKEHPLIMAAHRRYGDRVAFVGIVFQDDAGKARRYLVSRGEPPTGSYPNLVDPGSKVGIDYGVYGVPETYFVDRNGMIVTKRIGRVTSGLLETELRRLTR